MLTAGNLMHPFFFHWGKLTPKQLNVKLVAHFVHSKVAVTGSLELRIRHSMTKTFSRPRFLQCGFWPRKSQILIWILLWIFCSFTNPGTIPITILAVNSDHGLSFAGEESRTLVWVPFSLQIYSTFEFWRFKFSVVWVLVWVSSFYGDGGGSCTVNSCLFQGKGPKKSTNNSLATLPREICPENSPSDFCRRLLLRQSCGAKERSQQDLHLKPRPSPRPDVDLMLTRCRPASLEHQKLTNELSEVPPPKLALRIWPRKFNISQGEKNKLNGTNGAEFAVLFADVR